MALRDIRGLDLAMLRTFDALMRERSVSRAASRLFLSQPAVSASLARLRETFGDSLFTRTAHGVLPTARALALAPQVEKLLADLGALLDPGRPFDPAASSRVFRIAGSDHASHGILPVLGPALASMGSGIRLVWEPPGAWSLAERLQRGDLDLAVVARLRLPHDLAFTTLYEDPYVYATRRGHPSAGLPVTLDLFCALPQIFLGYGSSVLDDTIDDLLARAGRQRQAQIAVTSFAQIVHMLRHSDHAAVLAERVARQHAEHLEIRPLPFDSPRYHALVCWHHRAEGDSGAMWLRDQVVACVRGAPDPTIAATHNT